VQKSPWIVLVIGVLGCAALAVLSQSYLRQSPILQIRNGLNDEFHLKDLSVYPSPEGDGYTVAYTADPALAGQSAALNRSMVDVAESVMKRVSTTRVRVNAKTPDGEIHKLLYPPEPPQIPPKPSSPPVPPPGAQTGGNASPPAKQGYFGVTIPANHYRINCASAT